MRFVTATFLRIPSNINWLDSATIVLIGTGALALFYLSPLAAIGLCLGAAAIIYFSQRVDHLLYFLAFYLPLEEFVLKCVDYSVYPLLRYGIELVIYAVLLKVILGKLARQEKLFSSPIDVPLLLLAGLGIVSTFLNGLPLLAGVLGLRPLFRYAALFYLILHSNLSKEALPKLFKIILCIATLEVLIGLGQYFVGEPANELLRPKDLIIGQTIIDAREKWQDFYAGQKIFATLGRYNLLGAFLVGVLTLLFSYRFQKERFSLQQKLLLSGAVVVLLLTYSRLSWVGLSAGLITLLVIKGRKKLVLALGVASLVGVMSLSPGGTSLYKSEVQGSLKDRLLGPFTSDYWAMSSSSQRLFTVSQVASSISGLNLLIGYGPGTMGSLVTNLQEGVSQLHQIGDPSKLLIIGDVGWVALSGQMGLLGVALFLWLLAKLFKGALSVYKNSEDFWLKTLALTLGAYLVALVAMNFFSLAFEARVSSAYFWILAGVALKQYEEKN